MARACCSRVSVYLESLASATDTNLTPYHESMRSIRDFANLSHQGMRQTLSEGDQTREVVSSLRTDLFKLNGAFASCYPQAYRDPGGTAFSHLLDAAGDSLVPWAVRNQNVGDSAAGLYVVDCQDANTVHR